jgi:hypothetical protein
MFSLFSGTENNSLTAANAAGASPDDQIAWDGHIDMQSFACLSQIIFVTQGIDHLNDFVNDTRLLNTICGIFFAAKSI